MFCVQGDFINDDGMVRIRLSCEGKNENLGYYPWNKLIMQYNAKTVDALQEAFEKCDICPQSAEQLGGAWSPFQRDFGIFDIWKSYHYCKQTKFMMVLLEEVECPDIIHQEFFSQTEFIKCAYQGVYVRRSTGIIKRNFFHEGLFFLGNVWQPTTQVSRIEVTQFPMEVDLYICGIINIYDTENFFYEQYVYDTWKKFIRHDWKETVLKNLPLRQWIEYNLKDYFEERIRFLEKNILLSLNRTDIHIDRNSPFVLFNLYQNIYLQDHKLMEINYEKMQIISFSEKNEIGSEEALELFPPILFCKAADEKNRRYICSAQSFWRKGITMDHPFVTWLIKNAFLLNKYYKRQFMQIIDCIMYDEATNIISVINTIRKQMISLPEHHGVDVNGFPQLGKEDFWFGK